MLNNRIEDDDDNAALAATADVIEKAYLTHLKSDATRRRRFLDKFIELCDSSDIAYINERVDGFKRDFVCLLPLELVEKILGYLDWRDVLNCCSVSSLWNRTISQSFDNMWLKFIVDNIPLNESSLSNHQTDLNLKDLFVKLMNQKTRLETGKLFRTSKIDLVDINAIGLYKNIVCTANHIAKFWKYDEPVSNIGGTDRTKYWLCFKSIQLISRAANLKFDSTYLLVSTYFLTIDIYSLASHQLLCQYVGHTCSITSFDFSQDLRLVVTGSADNSIKYWYIHDGQQSSSLSLPSSSPHNSTNCDSLIMTEPNLTWPVHISIHEYNTTQDEYLITVLLADGYVFLNLVKRSDKIKISSTFRSLLNIQTSEFNVNTNQNFFDQDNYENLLISNRSWIKMINNSLTVYVVTENNSNQTKKLFTKRWSVDKCTEYDMFKIECLSVESDNSILSFLNRPTLKALDINRFEIITFASKYCLFLDEQNQFYLANLTERKIKCIQRELDVDARTTVVFRLMMTNTQENQFIFSSRDWLDGFKLDNESQEDVPFVWAFYSQKRNELFIVGWS